jgi:aspartate 1-decarboxylase
MTLAREEVPDQNGMFRQMLRAKIHRATVTGADLNYMGSLTLDAALLATAGILPYERVLVVDIDNGNRFETYAIAGPAGSGAVVVNGAAARLVQKGDKVIIMSFAYLDEREVARWEPRVVFVDENNRVTQVATGKAEMEIGASEGH